MPEKLILVATLTAKPGLGDQLGDRLSTLVEPTRGEAGNLGYVLHRARDDGNTWMLYENWRSKEDLDAHFEAPYLQAFLQAAPALLAKEMDLTFFRQIA